MTFWTTNYRLMPTTIFRSIGKRFRSGRLVKSPERLLISGNQLRSVGASVKKMSNSSLARDTIICGCSMEGEKLPPTLQRSSIRYRAGQWNCSRPNRVFSCLPRIFPVTCFVEGTEPSVRPAAVFASRHKATLMHRITRNIRRRF